MVPESGTWDTLGDGAAALNTGSGGTGTFGTLQVINAVGTVNSVEFTTHLDNAFDAGSLGYVVSPEVFDKLAPPDTGVNFMLLVYNPLDKTKGSDEVNKIVAGYGDLYVIGGNFIGQLIASVFDFLINAVNGLLGMSVVIALIGIVNTLSLSVFERRRELGLLRAVGMTRREVRRMVRLEAMQMSLLGTLIGLGAGSLLAWLLLRSTEVTEVTFGPKHLAVIFGVGILLGVVAAIAPARRVSKLNILDSIKTE